MSRYKMGKPKRKSRYICLKCLNENCVGEGIQRINQREKFHLKELYCVFCRQETKNLEIRHCDWFEEIKERAEKLHIEFYEKVG